MSNNDLYKLIWTSRPLMQAAEALVEKNLTGTGLTVRMRAVLEILHLHGDLPVPEVAHHLHINRQYVQLMVNETTEAALTKRIANPRHRRSALIALTETGAQVIAQVLAREQKVIGKLGAQFDTDDVATARRVSEELLVALTEAAESWEA